MTIWITDQPNSAAAFNPQPLNWTLLRHSSLNAATDAVAALFNPDKPTWQAESEPLEDKRIVVLIDEAESSQFDCASQYARQNANTAEELVCLALTGTKFRGQRQRVWSAIRGNLHFTSYYKLRLPADEVRAAITMIPAIAAAEAIETLSGSAGSPSIKWINDIWLGGRKVSGVLSSTQLSGNQIDSVVFGIGINVKHAPEITPTPFVPRAGCLADVCPELSELLPGLFHVLVAKLDFYIDRLRRGEHERIFDSYRRHAGFIGEYVRIWPEGTEDWINTPPAHRGRILSLNPDLSLNLDTAQQPVLSGRLAYEESCRLLLQ